VTAFQEHGDTFARLSLDVPESVQALLTPRPDGPGGTPAPYRYAPPPRLADGIRTAPGGADTIPVDVSGRLVSGVIDGTYPDVRSVLLYRHGALRLEEYFYGFERDRPHEMRSLTKSVVSLLAGIAVDRGRLALDEPVLGKLGYASYGHPDPGKNRITLRQLLSHQSARGMIGVMATHLGLEVRCHQMAPSRTLDQARHGRCDAGVAWV
jgi:CubicO group peptidase (beta-lactamase class C family)